MQVNVLARPGSENGHVKPNYLYQFICKTQINRSCTTWVQRQLHQLKLLCWKRSVCMSVASLILLRPQQPINCPCLLQCPSSGVVSFIKRLNAISRHPLPKPAAGLKFPSYLVSLLPPWSVCPFIWLQAQPVIDQLVN